MKPVEAVDEFGEAMGMTKHCLLLLAVLLWSRASVGGQYIPVNERKSHLDFNFEPGLPQLKFFETKDFKGLPLVELNDQGLFIGKTRKCRWPKGDFSTADSYNMVLEPISPSENKFGRIVEKPCTDSGPIRSTWGDGGIGTAVLFVELESLEKDIAKVTYGSKSLYLNLKNLKGRYTVREPGSILNKPGD